MPDTLLERRTKTGRSSLCCCLALVLATGLRLTCFGGCTGSWQISTDESHGDRYVREGYVPAFEAVSGFYHPAENYDEFHTYSINVPQGMKASVRITYERAVSSYSGGRMVVEDVKNEGEASYVRGQTYSVLLSSSRTINVRARAYRDEDGKGLCTCWYRISVEFKEDAPDLCVKSVVTDPSKYTPVDQPAALNFDVQNIGFRSSSASKARVYDGNAQLAQFDIPGLATDVLASRTLTLPSLAVGDHVLRVAIDSVAGENTTGNNERSFGLKVFNRTPYRVEFNANGGEGKMDPQDFVCGTPEALGRNAFAPPNGYEFDGWARDPKGAVTCRDGEQVENLTFEDGGTVVLYAVWKEIPSFSVYFDSNGGTGEMPTQQIFRDETVKLRKCAFERPGYRFVGWKRHFDGKSSDRVLDVIDEDVLSAVRRGGSWVVLHAGLNFNFNISGKTYPNRVDLPRRSDEEEICRGYPSYMCLVAVWGKEAVRIEQTGMSKGMDLVVSEDGAWTETYVGSIAVDDRICPPNGYPRDAFKSADDFAPGWLSVVVDGPVVVQLNPGTSCEVLSSMLIQVDGILCAQIYGSGSAVPRHGICWEGQFNCSVGPGRHVVTCQTGKSNEDADDGLRHCVWAGDITVRDARVVRYHANYPDVALKVCEQLVESGENVTVKGNQWSSDVQDRVFCGWSRKAESKEVVCRCDETLELNDTEKDVDLYAVWKTPGEVVGAPELDLRKNELASWRINDGLDEDGESLKFDVNYKDLESYTLDVEGGGVFSFWWKWCDYDEKPGRIEFTVDDKKIVELTENGDGWKNVCIEMQAGKHRLQWSASGDGWPVILLDEFSWVPGGACYVVQFAAGMGSGMMLQKLWASDKVHALPPCTFTPPAGKTRFAGWRCSNGRRYDDGMLVFDLAQPGETVTMTAIWE